MYSTGKYIQSPMINHKGLNMPANAGYARLIPGVRKIPWRRKWQPLQYSCLGSPMDRV